MYRIIKVATDLMKNMIATPCFCYEMYLLSRCPNVTVMGITSSNSLQATGGICYRSDDMFEVHYLIIYALDENNEFLEVTADRKAKVGFDLRIPVDYDAAMMIFSDSENDYELEYAIDYLLQNYN